MQPNSSNRRLALGNFTWLLADKLATLGGAAVIGILIARHLGPTDYGLQNYVVAIGAFVAAVSNLGLNGLITRDLVYQPDKEGEILGSVSGITTIAAAVITIAVGIWVALSPGVDPRIGWLIVLVAGSGILKRFDFLESWFVLHNKTKAYAVARITVTAIFMAVRIALLVMHADLQAFLITYAAEMAISGLRSMVAYKVAGGHARNWSFNWQVTSDSLRRSWPVLLSGITQFIYLRLDVMLLTWWTTPREAGIYSAAARLSEIWYFVPTLMMSALFPALLDLRRKNDPKYDGRLQDVLDLLAAMGMSVAIAVTACAWFVIPFLYGADYARATPILMVHVWAGIFVFMRALLSKWLIAEELYIYSLVTHTTGAVINIAINVWLIPTHAGMGAAIATLVSYATAGYLSLLLSKRTRPMFWMMTKSLIWFRRAPSLIRFAMSQVRSKAAA